MVATFRQVVGWSGGALDWLDWFGDAAPVVERKLAPNLQTTPNARIWDERQHMNTGINHLSGNQLREFLQDNAA